jgi:hypothetical protein
MGVSTGESRREMKAVRITFGVVGLIGLGLLGGGIFLIVQRETGTRAKATVTECEPTSASRYGGYECTGTWISGGDLVGGNGQVVIGTVEGAEPNNVGKTMEVTVSGDRAYSTSLRLPIVLLAIGLLMAAGSVFLVIKAGSPGSSRRPPEPRAS